MDKSSRLANITLPNAILPGTSTIIQWQLYDNSTLIDGPWSVTLEPMDAGNTVVVIIQTPGNGSFVIPLQTTVFCVFTTGTKETNCFTRHKLWCVCGVRVCLCACEHLVRAAQCTHVT